MARPRLIQDDELLAAARDVFVRRGIAASTRAIARRAGISEAVIFQRYRTKQDLFFAAMAPPPPDVDLPPPAPGRDPAARLSDIAEGVLDYFRRLMPSLLLLASHPNFDYARFARRHPDAPAHRLGADLEAWLRRAGVADSGPAATALVAMLHSLALFERLGVHGGSFSRKAVRSMVRRIWRGLAPDRPTRASAVREAAPSPRARSRRSDPSP